MKHSIAVGVARWIFGIFYLLVGLTGIAMLLLGKPFPQPISTPAEHAFVQALSSSGFMDPLISVANLVGGFLLLIRRTAPLGIVVLAPIVVGIFLYHLLLSGAVLIGTVQLAYWVVLAWFHRSAYRPLWQYGGSAA